MALSRTEKIDQIIDNLLDVINAKTAEWVSAGCPPTYSIDGESYQWDSWLKSKWDELKAAVAMKNQIGGPFRVISRGRA